MTTSITESEAKPIVGYTAKPLAFPDFKLKADTLEDWLAKADDGDTITIRKNDGHLFLQNKNKNEVYILACGA